MPMSSQDVTAARTVYDSSTSFDYEQRLPGFLNNAFEEVIGAVMQDLQRVCESVFADTGSEKGEGSTTQRTDQPDQQQKSMGQQIIDYIIENAVMYMVKGIASLCLCIFLAPFALMYRTVTHPVAAFGAMVVAAIHCFLSLKFAVFNPGSAWILVKHKMLDDERSERQASTTQPPPVLATQTNTNKSD